MKSTSFLFALVLSVASVASAATPSINPSIKTFKVGEEKQSVTTSIPMGWSVIADTDDANLSLISPKGIQDLSTVVQIIPTGEKDANDELARMKKNPVSYYESKDEEMGELESDVLSYLPMIESKNDGASVTSIGVKFENDLGQFINRSYYITTKKKDFFYMNVLTPVDLDEDHQALVGQVVDTVSAKN